MNLTDFIMYLDRQGVAAVLLPFILIFTIVFAVFQKAKILGDNKKNFNVMIALVMALAVVIPHITGTYPPNADIVNIINQSLPNVSVVVVAILMVLLLLGVFGWEFAGGSLSGIIAILCFGTIVYIFGAAANWWNPWLIEKIGIDAETQALLLIILIFGIIIWFITAEKKEKSTGEGLVKGLNELVKPVGK